MKKKTILCVGCSWTYGYGLSPNQTYPAYLQNCLKDYTVINAGHCGADISYAIFSAVRLIEELNPTLIIFQITTFDRITLGTDGYNNFLSDIYYDGRDDQIYFETDSTYKRVIGIADNIKTKITHGSYISKDVKSELLNSDIKNSNTQQYRNFISTLVENIIHSNYTHQRVYNELFLFQQYLKVKNIESCYFHWLPVENKFQQSVNSRLFNVEAFTVPIAVVNWFSENYSKDNYYIDNGFHLSSLGNKILTEEYLLPYISKKI